jgi:hypothetical protein
VVAEGVAEDGRRRTRLIPIDHGTILPDSLAVDECDAWAWLDWPQVSKTPSWPKSWANFSPF